MWRPEVGCALDPSRPRRSVLAAIGPRGPTSESAAPALNPTGPPRPATPSLQAPRSRSAVIDWPNEVRSRCRAGSAALTRPKFGSRSSTSCGDVLALERRAHGQFVKMIRDAPPVSKASWIRDCCPWTAPSGQPAAASPWCPAQGSGRLESVPLLSDGSQCCIPAGWADPPSPRCTASPAESTRIGRPTEAMGKTAEISLRVRV